MEHSCSGRFMEICRDRPWCRSLLPVLDKLYPDDDVHGLDHVLRVVCLSLEIAERSTGEVDYDILLAAALLHDVGRWTGKGHHAITSSLIARLILSSLGFPKDKLDRVMAVIREHSFSLGLKPSTLESCILSDADKLDALGAMGVYRLVSVTALTERGIRGLIKHYEEKLSRLVELMCTEHARAEGRKLLSYLSHFVKQLELSNSMAEALKRAMIEFLEHASPAPGQGVVYEQAGKDSIPRSRRGSRLSEYPGNSA